MTKTLYQSVPRKEGANAFGAIWLIHAPWAHPIWTNYFLALADLTTTLPPPHPKATLYREGMTHEMQLYACDPEMPWPTPEQFEMKETSPSNWERSSGWRPRMLSPANMAYQFPASSDVVAEARIQDLVDQIDRQELSPDTDFRRSRWMPLFADGVNLISSAFDPASRPKPINQ